jgi:NADH-quinone oxidoreductase subunit M
MTMTLIVFLPFIGGIVAWGAARKNPDAARWISIAFLALDALLLLSAWRAQGGAGLWLREIDVAWIPLIGARFHLAMDGLSLILALLSAFLGIVSVVISWSEIRERVGFFHLNLMWVISGILGVFTAMDLLLFSFFWEMMLIPMYFLIVIWGHENRVYASVKFFIFTQVSGLLMLASILGLYFIHGKQTGTYTFEFSQLLGTTLPPKTAMWLMLGFVAAFAVKLPVVPLHNWLPDAHTEAPTAGSVILAGLLLKTGAYGLIRFAVPLFPEAARVFTPYAMALGAIGIIYGAMLAFAQTDLKRLVAYTSVSHMGFVMIGIFAWNMWSLQGAVMQMVCHGIATGALFIIVGMLYERIHTRDLRRMGGFWAQAPRMGGVTMLFAMASLGLPGLGNFVAEILVMLGVYKVSVLTALIAGLGVVAATIYSIWIVQRVFQGPNVEALRVDDMSPRESIVMAVLVASIIWLGIYPRPVLDTAKPVLERLQGTMSIQSAADAASGSPRNDG